MSITVKVIGSLQPGIIPIVDGLSFEDVCIQCCRDLGILPASRHLFAIWNVNSNLYASPSDLLQASDAQYELRLRFWPSIANMSAIGSKALNYFYQQVCEDFVEGKITILNNRTHQKVALGLAITAMYCHMKDHNAKMTDVLINYKKFVPKMVRRNSNLKYSTESLKTGLNQVVQNPPGETWFCKQQFLRKVAQIATDYPVERYPVRVEEGEELLDFDLIIQPMSAEQPGVKLQSIKKKIPNRYVCSIEEICFVSIRKIDNRMEISRISGVPQYVLFEGEESMKSCVGALNGYYRLMEKWTFDLCGELVTPSLAKLRSLKCHGPVGDSFAYEKLRTKRQNKHGCYLLRESHTNYDDFYLDVCMAEDGEPATTFSIVKSTDGLWTFAGLNSQPCSSVRELLITQGNVKHLGIPGFELKECLPSSENDISDLLLCRQKPIEAEAPPGQNTSAQLPVCIPSHSVQLYIGAGFTHEFYGRFTIVQRGVWRRTQGEQVQIIHKLLKPEYRQSHYQAFLESVQKSIFWRSETMAHVFGIVLDANLRVIMEYFPLGPLDQYLRDHKLPVIDLVEAATNLAKALFYLEENGYVHGKVRCRNLMVASHTDNSIRVKLTDPGIHSYIDEELPWIPIELYDSLELVHRRSTADIWACGTCMWEIFSCGAIPCAGLSRSKMIQGFLAGWRLPRPENCLGEIYHIMIGTWYPDVTLRPKAQSVMRDINQILYEVYNSRRINVYEQLGNQCSWNGSIASGLTEATTLRALSEDQDTIPFNFVDFNFQDTQSLNFLFPNIAINGVSSLQMDDEGTSELTTEIYELDRKKLELGAVIGQGNYGEVRMGVIRHNDGTVETVAIKILRNSAKNNPESVDLQRECSIMRNLNHPNIVEIKAIVTEPSTLLVMEYFPLGCLLTYLRTQKESITNMQLIKFATDIAEGMAYLGENNIVHRDLAARNILVATEESVKISDFGLARQLGNYGYYVVRDSGQKLPVPWYAPESLLYWKFSVQSDVWSFGVTLYEMFSRGEEPNFVSGDQTLLLRALQQGRRLPCHPLCPPTIYRDLMKPCWDAEASKRPSFKALLDVLRCVGNQL